MSELIAGIDLGTTNSVLAVVQDGKVRVVNIHGQPIMPSAVGLDPAGKLIVGQAAKNQVIASPDATILSIKRHMGEDLKVPLGDKQYSPEEISALILREMKQEAERELGQPINKAVITVPAFFNERQRKATQVAGQLAGLEVVRIINEPTAAALAYGAGKTADETLLVYDLGGGTFDVSLVVVEDKVVEVKASHGDTHLGGDDFDRLLVEHAASEFKKRHGEKAALGPLELRRLQFIMERAKIRLSDEPFVAVREEYVDGKHHLEMEIRRDQYEEMITPLLEKTLTCMHQALQDAKLGPQDIDKVMLVGGVTRTPLVQGLIQHRMGLEPRHEISPDLIVAMGAAIQASVLAGEAQHSILIDITPHTYSLVTLGSFSMFGPQLLCTPIIHHNTPLPASKAELFTTTVDNQEEVQIKVCQGEGMLPEQNTALGEFLVQGLRKVPSGNLVLVHFDLDLNGMLKVTATEKDTGLAKSVVLDTHGQGVLNIEEARRNIATLISEPVPRPPDEIQPEALSEPTPASAPEAQPQALLNTAKDLRKRGEALLQKNISPEDAAEIREMIHASAEAIKNRAWSQLEDNNEALSDLLFYLED